MSPLSQTLQHILGWSGGENVAIRLLEQIDAYGSINRAAKAAGLSYKSAWEKIETLNNLSVKPLVIIDLLGGSTVTAINTSESVRRLGLARGMEVAAIFKASSVLLAIG